MNHLNMIKIQKYAFNVLKTQREHIQIVNVAMDYLVYATEYALNVQQIRQVFTLEIYSYKMRIKTND